MQSPVDLGGVLRLKRQAGSLWRLLPSRWGSAERRARVLLYHAIGDSPFAIAPEVFADQMEVLHQHGRVVPLAALLTGEAVFSEACYAITFDDGYAGVRAHALGALARFGFPATVFLTTGAIDDGAPGPLEHAGLLPEEPLLTWDEVRELDAAGVTMGSHLGRHLDLTTTPAALAREELRRSRDVIEQRLGRPCLDFAYPWGRYNLNAAAWVRGAGYRSAAAGFHAPVPRPIDPYAIPRLAIRRGYSLNDFRAILAGEWDFLGLVQRLRHRLSA